MIKSIPDSVLAFDIEWVPDPVSGRMTYNLPADMPDDEVREVMWEDGRKQQEKFNKGYAAQAERTDEPDKPYLKTALCRIVSIAVVWRMKDKDGVKVRLETFPKLGAGPIPERELLEKFFKFFEGRAKPQLVGFNSANADLPILVQRGAALGLAAKSFCHRPDKPWEGVDYFAKYGEGHIDLRDVFSGWGRASITLHEVATSCAIPGKIDVAGDNVINLWLEGDSERIVQYNAYDALTTYLLWHRAAGFSGLIPPDQHAKELTDLRQELDRQAQGVRPFLRQYLDKWEQLLALAASRG